MYPRLSGWEVQGNDAGGGGNNDRSEQEQNAKLIC